MGKFLGFLLVLLAWLVWTVAAASAQTTEKYANNPVGGATAILNTTIDADDTAVVVSVATYLPTSGTFGLLIGTEYLVCTAITGTTATCPTRGAEGSMAATHTAGAAVYHVITDRSLRNNPLAMTTAGDLPYLNASLAQARLGIGTEGDVLSVGPSGLPIWAAGTFPIQDGVNSAIEATVLDLTNSNPLTVAFVNTVGTHIDTFPVTNAGTFAVQEDGAALTALQSMATALTNLSQDCNDSYETTDAVSGITELLPLDVDEDYIICSVTFTSNSTTVNNVRLVEGTGTNCGTGTAGLTPLVTIDLDSSLPGISYGLSGGVLFGTTGNAVCLDTSASQSVGVLVAFVRYDATP